MTNTDATNNPVIGLLIAGVAVLVWMVLGDFPSLHEVALWVSSDDSHVNPQPAWKYIATATVGLLMLCLLVRFVVRDFFAGKT